MANVTMDDLSPEDRAQFLTARAEEVYQENRTLRRTLASLRQERDALRREVYSLRVSVFSWVGTDPDERFVEALQAADKAREAREER